MSRKGDCWDNAPMWSFLTALKRELVEHVDCQTPNEARADVFRYLEGSYNWPSLHGALGCLTDTPKTAPFLAAASPAQPSS